MKINVKIFFLLTCILSFSCKQEKKTETSCFIINSEFTEKDCVKLSDFVDFIEIIPLETNQKYLINTVGKIIKHEDFYYIGSATNLINEILVFDKNGKFIYKLNKRGMGPDEYTDIRDFDVIDNDKIVIISRSNPGIYVYDIHKDSCVLHSSIDIYPNNILAKDDHFYIMNDGTQFHRKTNDLIFKYDGRGNYIQSFFTINQSTLNVISNILPLISLSSYNNDLYFNYPFCNAIYKINDIQISSEYVLDFGEKKMSIDVLGGADNIAGIEKKIAENEGVNSLIYYAVDSRFCFFTFYDFQLNGYILLYDKKTNKTLVAHQIIDDIYFKNNKIDLKPWKLPILLSDNKIYYHIEPGELITFFHDYKKKLNNDEWRIFCKDHPQLIDKISKMKEDDNPVLLSIKLKQEL